MQSVVMMPVVMMVVFIFVIFTCLNDFVSCNEYLQSKDCTSDLDCTKDDVSSVCDITSLKCICPPKNNSMSPVVLILVHDRIQCLSGRKIGSECRMDQECLLEQPKSLCADNVCRCEKGFIFDKTNSCRVNGTSGEVDETNTAMLPIMIVMGLMFVGMCAAMNMFSKAQFKNSRGVFNQPHAARILKDVQVDRIGHQQQKRTRGDHRPSSKPSIAVDDLDTLDPRNLMPPASKRNSDVSVDLHLDPQQGQLEQPSTPHSIRSTH